MSSRPHLLVVVRVVDNVVRVRRQDAQHLRWVPHQIHAVEAHHAVAHVDLAGHHLAVVQRLELEDVHVPLALHHDGDRGKHHRLVSLVLDEAENELADRPRRDSAEQNEHGRFVGKRNEASIVVKVGSIEFPQFAR